jgi:hypothetical protein
MATVESTSIFAVPPNGSSAPDSLTYANGSLWVEYGNGASTTAFPGTSGSSTIVEYSRLGVVENTYTIGGHVDGLKYDPSTGDIWGLQNEDANATLTLIDPATKQVSQQLTYGSGYVYGANSSRGFDDVAFEKGKVFISETNPAKAGDPVVSELANGNAPFGTLYTNSILRLGDTGTNMLTGRTNQPLPVSDPDSLKTLPDGSLILTSEADHAFTIIHDPGTTLQSASFLTLPASAGTPDDAIMPDAKSGTFYLSDQGDNRVLAIRLTDINTHDLYASVGNNFDQIDTKTGGVTTLVGNLNGAHGLLFLPDSSTHTAAGMVPSPDTKIA